MKLPNRKIWVNVAWGVLALGTIVLLISAVTKSNHNACAGVQIEINGDANNFFVDEKDITVLLEANGKLAGKRKDAIDLRVLEARLKKEKWIANADLFFDNKNMLQAKVQENEPVARIFTINGSSFYIDSTCMRLPLSDKRSARVPMFTNFPSDRTKLSRPDSALMASIKEMSMIIRSTPFWKAQVAQIDISSEGFEMIPTIGNHVVELGNGENMKEKFDRLYSFYKQVWTKVGFEKYEKLDVQFEGQVVATKRGTTIISPDSEKAKEALNELIAQAKDEKEEVIAVAVTNNSDNKRNPSKEEKVIDDKAAQRAKPTAPIRVNEEAKANDKTEPQKEDEPRVPKAVMGRRDGGGK